MNPNSVIGLKKIEE